LCRVDANPVAITQKSNRAAAGGLRAHMADAHATRRAGESSIRNEGHFFAHALPDKKSGHAEHLAHAGAASRSLIPNDDDVSGRVASGTYSLDSRLLAVEDACRPFMHETRQARDLYQRTLRCEIAVKHNDSSP
jgi:hypothetical protein